MNVKIFAGALAFCVFFLGCSKSDPRPEPLALADVPAALREAFASAEENLKNMAESTAAAVTENKLPAASIQLHQLAGSPALQPEQRDVVARATITVNEQLQAMLPVAPEPGSEVQGAPPSNPQEAAAAAAVLQHYQATK